MSALANGKRLLVATVGGSITAGHGSHDTPDWPRYLFDYYTDHYGRAVVGHVAAVPGTTSAFMSICHNMHVPRDVDIVFLEYSVNDLAISRPEVNNPERRAYERLVRTLLQYPSRPAVILMHSYQFNPPDVTGKALFYNSAERELSELALYYDLPQTSVRACCYSLMARGVNGFWVNATRSGNGPVRMRDYAFYWDTAHPSGPTGHRVMGELAIHVLQHAADSLKARPLSEEEEAEASGRDGVPLLAPMLPHNYESASTQCFIGNQFRESVVSKDAAWEWLNDSKKPRPKWGYISTQVGSSIKLKVDSRMPSDIKNMMAVLQLAYLRSYEHMGAARVTCESGCECSASELDGHGRERTSQLHLHAFYASQHPECVIKVTVLPATQSGEHKVKLAGIMVVGNHPMRVRGSVETVHDISTLGRGGIFDSRNHIG